MYEFLNKILRLFIELAAHFKAQGSYRVIHIGQLLIRWHGFACSKSYTFTVVSRQRDVTYLDIFQVRRPQTYMMMYDQCQMPAAVINVL